MANINLILTPPVAADLSTGKLRVTIGNGQVLIEHYADPAALPRRAVLPFASLQAATRADGQTFLNDLLTTEGALALMGY